MNVDHVFIALNTSNSNPKIGHITDLAVVRTSRTGRVLCAYSDIVQPTGKAYEYRGRPFAHVMHDLLDKVITPYSKFMMVSAQAETDKTFIRSAWKLAKLGPAQFHNHPWCDILSLTWPLAFHDLIPENTVEAASAHFGLDYNETSIEEKCASLTRLYWAVMQRYRTSLLSEEAIRDMGGRPLAIARRILNF